MPRALEMATAVPQSIRSLIEHLLQKQHSESAVYILFLFILAAYFLPKYVSYRRRYDPTRPQTPTIEKASSSSPSISSSSQPKIAQLPRKVAEWTPSDFVMPTPPPYPDWSIETTKPLPYRPFRYGPKYHTTMGLRNVPYSEWIELDNQFPRFHEVRTRRIMTRGRKCVRTAPEAYPAAIELLEELIAYLPARYPSLYRAITSSSSSAGSDVNIGIENLWSGEKFYVPSSPPSSHTNNDKNDEEMDQKDIMQDPMAISAKLVQDDLTILMEHPDNGHYYFLAGALLLAGFWRLQDKFGMNLSDIHNTGDVPEFKTKLEKGVMNLFQRLKPEELVGRSNYFLQVDDGLAWSWSIGSEDWDDSDSDNDDSPGNPDSSTSPSSPSSSADGQKRRKKRDPGVPAVGWFTAPKNTPISNHYFRSERHSIRRLPRTGAIVFTIRTYFHPVVEIAEEDYVPGRLASAVRSWGDDVSRYKGRELYQDVLLEYLDRKHREQIDRGLDLSREDEVRAYPY